MTKQELQERIEKAKVRLEKIEKRLSKWGTGLGDEAKDIAEKAGDIVDASNLHIDAKGNIAGTIQGTKNKVALWTTLSGGYNIQIAHYRSYCNVVK